MIVMSDRSLSDILGEMQVEELKTATAEIARLQAALEQPRLRQLLAYIESDKYDSVTVELRRE